MHEDEKKISDALSHRRLRLVCDELMRSNNRDLSEISARHTIFYCFQIEDGKILST